MSVFCSDLTKSKIRLVVFLFFILIGLVAILLFFGQSASGKITHIDLSPHYVTNGKLVYFNWWWFDDPEKEVEEMFKRDFLTDEKNIVKNADP